jgi:hypothetical protein
MAKSEIKRETRATSQLKRQNANTLYKDGNYQRIPNKKRLAQAMEEEDTQRPRRGPPGTRIWKKMLKDSRKKKKKPYSIAGDPGSTSTRDGQVGTRQKLWSLTQLK